MKTNKFVEELKSKSVVELKEELVAAKKELFNLRFQNATNQLDNTSRIKEVRKNIARIQTVLTEAAKAAALSAMKFLSLSPCLFTPLRSSHKILPDSICHSTVSSALYRQPGHVLQVCGRNHCPLPAG